MAFSYSLYASPSSSKLSNESLNPPVSTPAHPAVNLFPYPAHWIHHLPILGIKRAPLVVLVGSLGLASNIVGLLLFHGKWALSPHHSA
jgi:hypothetical protein